jgi:capsular exopolysaccharide synthesis family protein
MLGAETKSLSQFHDSHSSSEKQVDLYFVFKAFAKYKWVISFLSILITILASFVLLSIKPTFRAESTMLIEADQSRVASINELFSYNVRNSDYYRTQFEILKSRSLAEQVVEELSLIKEPEFDPRMDAMPWYRKYLPAEINGLPLYSKDNGYDSADKLLNEVISRFSSGLTISPVAKTQIVKIVYESKKPELAAEIANKITDIYIARGNIENSRVIGETATWMSKRLKELSASLKQSERRLQTFKEKEGLLDLKGVMTLSATELEKITAQLVRERQELRRASSLIEQIKNIEGGEISSILASVDNPVLRQLEIDKANAQQRVAEISKRYGPKHPKMISARQELNSLTDSIALQLKELIKRVEGDFEVRKLNVSQLEESLKLAKDSTQSISRKQYKLQELEREVKTTKDIYNLFLKRVKEASASEGLDSSNARVIDRAIVPSIPSKPNKSLILSLVLTLTFAALTAAAVVLELISDVFVIPSDIEQRFNIPVLSVIPFIKRAKKKKLSTLSLDNEEFSFSEAFRTLRTSVALSSLKGNMQVILVTSAIPNEGKTTVSSNLALSLGKSERVLYIDADLRRPSVNKNMGLDSEKPGLSDLISGNAYMEECIQKIGDIDVLSAGSISAYAHELLSETVVDSLFEKLKLAYDRIVIDSPPVNSVSDSLLLSSKSNAVIFVIKADSTKTPQVRSGLNRLLHSKVFVLGSVLNFSDAKRRENSGYQYDGYYGNDIVEESMGREGSS